MVTASEADQKLVQRAQRGDLRAFDLLVLKYQGRISALVSRYLSDSGDVEDVTQEAFIKAYRALERFRGDSAFYTWLYRIAANAAKNHLVAKGRRPRSDASIEDAEAFDEFGLNSDSGSPEAIAMGDELLASSMRRCRHCRGIESCMTSGSLTGSLRRYCRGAECPVGTVRSRIFRRVRRSMNVREQIGGGSGFR